MEFTGEFNSSQPLQPFRDGANPDSMISGKPIDYFGDWNFLAEQDFFYPEFAQDFKEFSQQGVDSSSLQKPSLDPTTTPSNGMDPFQGLDPSEFPWSHPFWTEPSTPVPNQGASSHSMNALSPSPAPIVGATSNLETQPESSKVLVGGATIHPAPAPAHFGPFVGHRTPVYHQPASVVPTVPRICSAQPGNRTVRPFLSGLLVNPYRMDERSRAIRFLREYPSADLGFQDTKDDVAKVIELAHKAGFFELERGYSDGPLSSFSYEMGDPSPFAMAVRYAKCPLIDPDAWKDCEAHVKEILSTKLNAKGEIVLKELDLECVEKSPLAQKTDGYIQAVKYARDSLQQEKNWSFEEMRREGVVDWLVKHDLFR